MPSRQDAIFDGWRVQLGAVSDNFRFLTAIVQCLWYKRPSQVRVNAAVRGFGVSVSLLERDPASGHARRDGCRREGLRALALARSLRLLATALGFACLSLPVASAGAAVPAQPHGTNDAGGFRNVLPPGENGLLNSTQLTEFELNKTYPPHFKDQLPLYAGLLYASPTLTHEQIPTYFKDATFGINEGDLGGTEQPLTRTDVTIYRDASFGVPHIYGSSRGGVMFGAGYAAAADRLFFIDVLRHTARAELSSFIGGAAGNRAMDRVQWSIAPYTEADLESQISNAVKLYGADGEKVLNDVKEFVAGINAYIDEALINPNKMPAEYAALKQAPTEWKPTDVLAEASLIGGIFGKGGGSEVRSALALQALEKQLGKSRGRSTWKTFREHNDPEAPVTVSASFPYETASPFATTGLAMPDPGSVSFVNVGEEVAAPGPSRVASSATRPARLTNAAVTTDTPDPAAIPNDGSIGSQLLRQSLAGPPHASNWELVHASHSTDAHSIAVMGPQVGYYVPEVLMG